MKTPITIGSERMKSIRLLSTALYLLLLMLNTEVLAQVGIKWRTLDPSVVSQFGSEPATLNVQTYGDPEQVVLKFADNSEVFLENEGSGKFSTVIPHQKLVYGYSASKSLHNFVGQIVLGSAAYNVIVNIDDGNIATVPSIELDEGSQLSPRVLNIQMPIEKTYGANSETFTRILYEYFADEFDFINIVKQAAEYRAMNFEDVRNSVRGLGLGLYDYSSEFGSAGRLDGVINVPNPEYHDMASPVYLRTMAYNWMNHSRHWKLKGATPHWPISHIALGMMGYQPPGSDQYQPFTYYFEKQMAGLFFARYWTGDYYLAPLWQGNNDFNSMELYLMGLLPAEEVGGYSVLQNQHQEVCAYCVVKGPLEIYDVDDLIALHGPREPGYPLAQRDFNIATIVVSNERLLTQRELNFFDHMSARGEGTGTVPYSYGRENGAAEPFREATFGRGSIDAAITKELINKITPAISDAWYDPNNPGQGFFVEVLPKSKRLSINWFTFETWRPRILEKQIGDEYHRWFTAQGKYEGSQARLKLYETRGGMFGSNAVTSTHEIGDLDFRINGCGHARVEYDIESINRRETIYLRRITDDHIDWCEESQLEEKNPVSELLAKSNQPSGNESDDFQINRGLTGTWFNPEWDGQGFYVSVLPKNEQMVVGWFTYDVSRPDGSAFYRFGDPGHRWLTAQGPYEGDTASLQLVLTSGGEFATLSPRLNSEPYGSLTMQFESCERARVQYAIPTAGISGTFQIHKVSDENLDFCRQLGGQPPPAGPPPQAPAGNSISVVDSSENYVGRYSSIAIGTDQLPIISYHDETAGSLKVAKCNEVACFGGDELVTTVLNPPGSDFGEYSSIAIGADGLPIISFLDRKTGSLMVGQCNKEDCSTGFESYYQVDGKTENVGHFGSLAIGSDNFPVIAYRNFSTGELKVAKCNDVACRGSDELISTIPDQGITAEFISLAIGANGFPAISYYDFASRSLKFVACNDHACAGNDDFANTVDDHDEVGAYSSLAIGKDGLPVIAYRDSTAQAIKVAKCNDPSCSGADETVSFVDVIEGDSLIKPSIAIGDDGLPVISYTNNTAQSLKVLKCNDLACTGSNELILTLEDTANRYISGDIAVGSDGLPIMTYLDDTDKVLKAFHCGTPDCASSEPPARTEGPVLNFPINNEIIEQNNPETGCDYHPHRGYGYVIDFDWDDIDAHSVRYQLIAERIGARLRMIDTFTTDSSYSRISCNGFVIPNNLEDWVWRVRAHIREEPHSQEIISEWSEGTFQFEECTLADGLACSAPPEGK